MREFRLFFEQNQLFQVEFCNGISGEFRRSIRGKQSETDPSVGTFQWTSAVRGLALLVVRKAARFEDSSISGLSGTVAASLDYAISKQPLWLTEMFGCDRLGTSLVRRMIFRTNPERKRPGPTTLSINDKYLPSESISVFCDGRRCSREELIVLAVGLSCDWASTATRGAIAEAA
jgi:hypothetical protein